MSSVERRRAFRFSVGRGQGWVETNGGIKTPVVDISASGISTVGTDVFPDSGEVMVGFRDSRGFRVHVKRARADLDHFGETVVGRQIAPVSLGAQRDLFNLLSTLDNPSDNLVSRLNTAESLPRLSFDDNKEIVGLLEYHGIENENSLRIYEPNGVLIGVFYLERIEMIHFTCQLVSGVLPIKGRKYRCVLGGRTASYMFESIVVPAGNTKIVCTIPSRLVSAGFRCSERILLEERWKGKVTHKRDGNKVPIKVTEISSRGILFSSEGYWFAPHDILEDIEVSMPGGNTLIGTGAVSHLRSVDTSGQTVGLHIREFANTDAERQWYALVCKKSDGGVAVGVEDRADHGWEALDDAGYLDAWVNNRPRDVCKSDHQRCWTSPDYANSRAAFLYVDNKEKSPAGYFATSRVYPQTWMVHHLAVDRSRFETRRSFMTAVRQVQSSLYCSIASTDTGEYWMGNFASKKKWVALTYKNFENRFSEKNDVLVASYETYVCDPVLVQKPLEKNNTISILEGDQIDYDSIAESLASQMSKLEHDVFHYCSTSLEKQDVLKNAHGSRMRKVFVGCVNEEPHWVVVCDVGPIGLNIFGIQNNMRMFPLCSSAKSESAVVASVIQRVRKWAASYRCRDLVFLDRHHGIESSFLSRLGFSYRCAGAMWIQSRKAMAASESGFGDFFELVTRPTKEFYA